MTNDKATSGYPQPTPCKNGLSQIAFRWIISGSSWYSSALTHICRLVYTAKEGTTFRKVPNPARIEPPIHVVYFRSGGAKILIFVPLTARRSNSFLTRWPKPTLASLEMDIPFVRVVPPDNTIVPKRFVRRSISVRFIELNNISWTPWYSVPMISGLNKSSVARNRSAPSFH